MKKLRIFLRKENKFESLGIKFYEKCLCDFDACDENCNCGNPKNYASNGWSKAMGVDYETFLEPPQQ
ncbi:hypothetical protein NLC29_00400 [Candidatus Aminicenantes bacterium AH-873-B07]|jgi:hypothetical protein|nr:hypothetical protein [Candidatus Aminicenantes bacterium AH-873-B07]